MMAILGGISGRKEAPLHPPVDIKWIRNAKGKFHNLMMLDTETERLQRTSGVFAIWRGGVKPEWLYAGATGNMDETLNHFINNDATMEEHYGRGRVYVSWSLIKSVYQDGIVRYLNEVMKPEIENPACEMLNHDKVPMIAVFLPGLEK